MLLRMAWTSRSFCLSLPRARITILCATTPNSKVLRSGLCSHSKWLMSFSLPADEVCPRLFLQFCSPSVPVHFFSSFFFFLLFSSWDITLFQECLSFDLASWSSGMLRASGWLVSVSLPHRPSHTHFS